MEAAKVRVQAQALNLSLDYSIVVGNVNGEVKKLYSLIESIQSKKGKFDALFCAGRFFPPKSEELEELYQEVMKKGGQTPIPTHFIDSTPLIAPFMNSEKTKNGFDMAKGLSFLGRSGLKVISGLRVAYISGIDFDVLAGPETQGSAEQQYIGSYFTKADVTKVMNDYEALLKSSQREGVDILLASQWPLGIDTDYFNSLPLKDQKETLQNSSSSLAALIDLMKPRYIYSSNSDIHHKRLPFLSPASKHLSRFISLGSLPGKHKPESSKTVYIQAIEIEPLTAMAIEDKFDCEYTPSPYFESITGESLDQRLNQALELRLTLGQKIVQLEDQEAANKRKSLEEQKHPSITGLDESTYRKEERIIYVTGFDRKTSFVDLEHFMKQYGDIVQVQKKIDEKGRGKGFVFVEYKERESAERAVEESGRANLMGNRLTINYKISKIKVVEDRDCWFCLDNPKIERHLIFQQRPNFYAALPKGPVTDEHFLIVPNKHIAHTLELEVGDAIEEEYLKLKQDLVDYIVQERQMDYLLFERNIPFNFQKAAHMNVQLIGLPTQGSLSLTLEDRVRKLLATSEHQFNSKFLEITDREMDLRAALGNDPTKHFFYLEIPGMKTARGRQRVRFVTTIEGQQNRFDMQFGRVMACHILNQREKLNWKNCSLERDQEEQLAQKFKAAIDKRVAAAKSQE
ncbi:hypothetical protein FGO68_gene10308 [Halteria grandinella]|uniref:RRM domain-containing protein n=1 Tax=Halteria grandinella TaxID=5974 RepID=A0A8J8T827_HALGN|nr:hypothetical protein FGO68_gene10308 [Halteria grandinella]